MRIVVFGPERRVGCWEGDEIVDVQRACAKYLGERQGELRPYDLAASLVPPDLRGFIEGEARALDHAQRAVEYLTREAGDRAGVRREPLIFSVDAVKLHPPLANPGS